MGAFSLRNIVLQDRGGGLGLGLLDATPFTSHLCGLLLAPASLSLITQ